MFWQQVLDIIIIVVAVVVMRRVLPCLDWSLPILQQPLPAHPLGSIISRPESRSLSQHGHIVLASHEERKSNFIQRDVTERRGHRGAAEMLVWKANGGGVRGREDGARDGDDEDAVPALPPRPTG